MPTNIDLKGLRVAVTGGTSGLGLALVRLLTGRGVCVAFVARTAETVKHIANETGAFGIVGDIGHKEGIYPIATQITGNLAGWTHSSTMLPHLGRRRSRCLRIRNARS